MAHNKTASKKPDLTVVDPLMRINEIAGKLELQSKTTLIQIGSVLNRMQRQLRDLETSVQRMDKVNRDLIRDIARHTTLFLDEIGDSL